MEVISHRPFGPTVYQSKCPDDILLGLEEYVECTEDIWFPNLLSRDIPNVYLTKDKCEKLGLKKILESLGNHYLNNETDLYSRSIERVTLNVFDDQHYDCWINRYFKGDLTPIHHHDAVLSGIIFLRVPDQIKQQSPNKMNGRVQFVYGEDNMFCPNLWTPEQEDGMILIFPSWLNHLVYSQTTVKERRTLSFNLSK